MKKILCLFIVSFLIQFSCFSQLTVTTNSNAATLAQNILGSGVTVSNAIINCGSNGSGTFTYSGSTLGLTNGILLTSGYASDASLPANIVSEFTGNNFTDPDLATISSGASMFDVCYIAFDFVPLCNQISIKFEFGSSEYDGFQCSSYNDCFGFFLTGLNPGGGNYSSFNLALLPSGTAVSINNVNNGQPPCTSSHNPSYYIDNSSGSDVVYEGLTTAITSVMPVVPCNTYHIKIAIADIGDEAYDSGVFIQGNSLNCTNTPTVTTSVIAANCGNTGSATATVTNYTATPTYQWLPGNATTPSITNIAAGTYTCLVGLQSGCGTTTQTVIAVVPSTGSTLNFTTNLQNPLCNNGTNGSVGVSISGGTSPYTYTWTTTPAQNTATTTATLPAGTYTLNMTDNNGCAGTASVTLTNPAPITATVNTSPTTCTGSTGSATATCSGLAPYTYTWTTTAHTSTINLLSQGTYSVLITDVNTCTVTASGIVGGQGFVWSLAATATNPKCINSTNGTATATITNPGVNTFTYSWNTLPVQTNSVATTLSASSYVATVTDNNGCTSTASVTLTNPAPITVTVNTSSTTCTGSVGSATATCSGLAPYTYSWTTTAHTSTINLLPQGPCGVAVTDANGCSATATATVGTQGFTWVLSVAGTNPKCINSTNGTATATITNPGANTFTYSWNTLPVQTNSVAITLSASSYVATVTDNNGCTSTASVTLTNPAPTTATVNTTPTICLGSVGSATAVCSGPAPYTYTWTTSASTSTVSGLPQGSCGVAITDGNGCLAIASETVGVTQAFTWVPVVTSTPTKCFGSSNGSATVTITNQGANTFTAYAWTPTAQTNSVAINLSMGNYIVTVTDNNGCVGTASTSVAQPTQLTASANSTPAMCTTANGIATGFPSGGTPPYTYSWNTNSQTAQTAMGLAPGSYIISVIDNNGCATTATVIVKDTTDLKVTASSSPDLCSKGVGKATANPTGQTPYTYTWSTTSAQSTQTADSLVVGTYSVNVTDANGCMASATTTVINHDDILATQFIITPPGEIDAENPIGLIILANNGWRIVTAFVVDSLGLTKTIITSNPFTYVFPKYGSYIATYYYTSANGCKDTIVEHIIVKDYMTLYIPNAFTPNGDGVNETFAAEGTFVNKFQMYIYDRWGILVTVLDDIKETWDGNKDGGLAPQDTYVYIGSASDIFGKHVNFSGQVNLIR